ncbi:MAG: hypothetical protein RL748_3256 [Pseudomonadota bacterium]|jgi:predicted amidohydrolase YtcJ
MQNSRRWASLRCPALLQHALFAGLASLGCAISAPAVAGPLALTKADTAPTIIEHANGYTLSQGKLVQFDALAFDAKGKIIAIGSQADVAAATAKLPAARHIDMQGKTVLPGLIDAHGHVFSQGELAAQLVLRDSRSLQEAQSMIAAYAKANPQRTWLYGFGWNQAVWKLGRFPTAAEIDAVVADKPVWLERVDGHAGWANSKALQLAGITKDTKDPAGGKIERDAKGNPSGVLVDSAMRLVSKNAPGPTQAELRLALDAAMVQLASMGLTSVHDAGVRPEQDALFREYAAAGKLLVRVYGMISGTGAEFDKLAAKGPLPGMADDHYALRAVKLFSDGALGSRGAALLQPYADAAPAKGLLFVDDATMQAQMRKAMQAGYQVNVHAIGDGGNRQVLDSFAKLLPQFKQQDMRHRVEHAQVVDLADIPRFKQLGIVPSMQPTHATSDKNMAEQRVGPERIKGAYAWRSFLQQDSRIACGSDFPIESPNPFWGIHAGVTRQDMEGKPVAGWYPNQAMSVFEAWRCFTLDAAWAAHQDSKLGSLEVGKWADFIVTDQDLFTMPTYDIFKMKVLQTWVGGRQVFAAATKTDKQP